MLEFNYKIKKRYFLFIGATLTVITISLPCFSSVIDEILVNNKEESKKIAQVNNIITTSSIDYIPVRLPLLVGMADLIAIGEVTEVGDSTFTFNVDEFLFNKYSSSSLIISKFTPSKFYNPRPLAYSAKQRFVLFLSKPQQDNIQFPWSIIGYTGEGEMPIEDGFVYFEGSFIIGLERKQYDIQGVSRILQRFNLDDFEDAVIYYRTCFTWKLVEYIKNKKKRTRWIPSTKCSNALIKNYQEKSWLHEYLAKKAIKQIPVEKQ